MNGTAAATAIIARSVRLPLRSRWIWELGYESISAAFDRNNQAVPPESWTVIGAQVYRVDVPSKGQTVRVKRYS